LPARFKEIKGAQKYGNEKGRDLKIASVGSLSDIFGQTGKFKGICA